jgi:hypothetical protein
MSELKQKLGKAQAARLEQLEMVGGGAEVKA